eukprot:scaffold666165_cov64-Prasinocladus_malaysianus.AAC.1
MAMSASKVTNQCIQFLHCNADVTDIIDLLSMACKPKQTVELRQYAMYRQSDDDKNDQRMPADAGKTTAQ